MEAAKISRTGLTTISASRMEMEITRFVAKLHNENFEKVDRRLKNSAGNKMSGVSKSFKVKFGLKGLFGF